MTISTQLLAVFMLACSAAPSRDDAPTPDEASPVLAVLCLPSNGDEPTCYVCNLDARPGETPCREMRNPTDEDEDPRICIGDYCVGCHNDGTVGHCTFWKKGTNWSCYITGEGGVSESGCMINPWGGVHGV